MKRVLISSVCGGVGCTTVVANLAAALESLGQRTLSIDFDPGNVLRLHFGVDPLEEDGWLSSLSRGGQLRDVVFEGGAGALVLPHSYISAKGGEFDSLCRKLRDAIDHLSGIDWLLMDVPNHQIGRNSAALQGLLDTANLKLSVVLPDPVNYSLLKLHPRWRFQASQPRSLLVNRVAPDQVLSTDMLAVLQREFDAQMVPLYIHQEPAAPEALASLASLQSFAPHSQAAGDFRALALWCVNELRVDR